MTRNTAAARLHWVRIGTDRKLAILALVEARQPCQLTDDEIGRELGITGRQVRRHLKALLAAGMLRSVVRHRRGLTQVLTERELLVESGHGHPVPEGQVGLEADAEPGAGTAGPDPADPEDLQ